MIFFLYNVYDLQFFFVKCNRLRNVEKIVIFFFATNYNFVKS